MLIGNCAIVWRFLVERAMVLSKPIPGSRPSEWRGSISPDLIVSDVDMPGEMAPSSFVTSGLIRS
jgi:hypothetical protein